MTIHPCWGTLFQVPWWQEIYPWRCITPLDIIKMHPFIPQDIIKIASTPPQYFIKSCNSLKTQLLFLNRGCVSINWNSPFAHLMGGRNGWTWSLATDIIYLQGERVQITAWQTHTLHVSAQPQGQNFEGILKLVSQIFHPSQHAC